MTNPGQGDYSAREVVGVFDSPEKLEQAFAALENAGFDRADLNVMASHAIVVEKLGHDFKVRDVEDDPKVPQGTFVSEDNITQVQSAAFGVPFYIGAAGSALAVVASGGALAMAIAAAAGGGLIGGGVGGLIAKMIGDHHAKSIEANLKSGGILLWVAVKQDEDENRAIEIMKAAGGRDVHPHRIERTWGEQDVPLHDVQPDPLLDKGPDYKSN